MAWLAALAIFAVACEAMAETASVAPPPVLPSAAPSAVRLTAPTFEVAAAWSSLR